MTNSFSAHAIGNPLKNINPKYITLLLAYLVSAAYIDYKDHKNKSNDELPQEKNESTEKDIEQIESKSKFPKKSKHFILDLDNSYLEGNITPENLKRWLEHMDSAYEAYAELVGKAAVDGNPITIHAEDGYPINNHGACGWVFPKDYDSNLKGWTNYKNDIYWNNNCSIGCCLNKDLQLANNEDDWSFTILHELGHLFDLDDRWTFDSEFFANFKKIFVHDSKNAINTWGIDNIYTKENISELHCSKTGNAYNDRLGAYNATYSDDSMVFKFIELKDKVGWEPFKKVFRRFLSLPMEKLARTVFDRYNMFMQFLSEEIGFDAKKAMFTDEQQKVVDEHFKNL